MNMIGERSRGGQFLDLLIEKILKDEVVTIHGNESTCDFNKNKYLHAREVGLALLFILNLDLSRVKITDSHKMHKVHKFNIAPNESIDTWEFANLVAKILGKDLKYKIQESVSGKPKATSLNGNFLQNLGWKPNMTFEQSVEKIIRWCKENNEWIKL